MVGGSSTDGLFLSIAGSVYMNVVNSTAAFLYGGCGEVNLAPIGKTFIGDSIYLNVTNSNIGTLAGAGSSPGIGDNSIAVQRDVNVFVHNSNITTMLTPVSNSRRNNVGGNVTLTTSNSTIQTLIGSYGGDVFGNLTLNIENGTKILRNVVSSGVGTIYGVTTINITDSVVNNNLILSSSLGVDSNPVILNVTDSIINSIICGPYSRGGTLKEGTVNIYSGLINTLGLTPESIAPNIGRTNLITANIYDGSINVIFIGSEHPHNNILGISTINISGGNIREIFPTIFGYAEVNFIPGKESIIKFAIDGNNNPGTQPVNLINIQKGAKTQWGNRNNTFPVDTNNIYFAGQVSIGSNSTIELKIHENLTTSGGIFNLISLKNQTIQPAIQLLAGEQSTLNINTPLTFKLSHSPELLSTTSVPVAHAIGTFANSDLFTKKIE